MNPLSWLSSSLGLLGSVGKIGLGIYENAQANKIHPEWSQYTTSPFAKQQLGISQQLFNGRAAGASQEEKNIAGNQASTIGNINRNATDSSQALALAGQAQGASNQAYSNLGGQEEKNKVMMLGNLNDAYKTMIGEGDKEYQSKLLKYEMDTKQQADVRNSAFQNMFGGVNDAAGLFGTMGQQQDQNDFWKKYFSNLT